MEVFAMKIKMFCLFVVGVILLSVSAVNAQIQPGSFFVSPNIGYYYFDKEKQNIDKTLIYGAGFGYNIFDQLGVEGIINRFNTETEIGKVDVKGYLGRLDFLTYFTPDKKFVPYFAFGVGDLYIDQSGSDSTSKGFGNYGLGFKWFLTDKIALRADARHAFPSNVNNYIVTTGLSFNFGGKKKAQVIEEKPAAQAAPPKDSDGDGVIDDMDQCPNTPAGIKVDGKGCPLDSDGDGVTDDKDQCPNTPAGAKVDGKGCPLDSDGDGVTDDKDQCPNTPAGTKVDGKGCPFDSDKDGVIDDKDQCPNTPDGATVDARGCWILKNLNFDTAKAEIKAEGARILDDVVPIMQNNPSLRLEVQGHTDNKGSAVYNKKLSQKRADAVMEYLVKKGIGKDRLTAVGYGLVKPAASNDTEEGRAENRRVELNPIQ
jgi:OmpA-OmpF porin, OOP family